MEVTKKSWYDSLLQRKKKTFAERTMCTSSIWFAFSLQAYRVKSIEVAFQGGAPKDVHMTAGDYFDWTKHNGIVASLIAVSRWKKNSEVASSNHFTIVVIFHWKFTYRAIPIRLLSLLGRFPFISGYLYSIISFWLLSFFSPCFIPLCFLCCFTSWISETLVLYQWSACVSRGKPYNVISSPKATNFLKHYLKLKDLKKAYISFSHFRRPKLEVSNSLVWLYIIIYIWRTDAVK